MRMGCFSSQLHPVSCLCGSVAVLVWECGCACVGMLLRLCVSVAGAAEACWLPACLLETRTLLIRAYHYLLVCFAQEKHPHHRQRRQQQQPRRQQQQQQERQQQQQQEQWAKAEEMAAQLLAEEEAEKARAAAKACKAKGAKAAKQAKGARRAKGVQQTDGSGREDEAVQVGVNERDSEATESASAASAAAASEAGPRGGAVAVRCVSAAAMMKAVGAQPAVQAAAHNFHARDSAASASGPKGTSVAGAQDQGSSASALAASPLQLPPDTAYTAPAASPLALTPTPVSGAAPSASSMPPMPTPVCEAAPSTLSQAPMPSPFCGAAPAPYAAAPLPVGTATAPSPAAPPPTIHDDGLCVVCMERRRSTVLVPCSHVVMCQACCDAVREARDEVRLVGVFAACQGSYVESL